MTLQLRSEEAGVKSALLKVGRLDNRWDTPSEEGG